MMLMFLAVLLSTHGCAAEFDYYDIATQYEQFQVDCGTRESPIMLIRYLGDANSVYADLEPVNCTLTEVATAYFQIDDTLTNPSCPVVNHDHLNVRSLDVVVQTGAVRKVTDEAHVIICNYEAGGQGISDQKEAIEGRLNWTPEFTVVDDKTSSGNISLYVYGIEGYPLNEVVLGSYIQLRAFFMPSAEEASLRLWNCRALAGTDDTYYMFTNGCGDGQVVAYHRGFRTAVEEDLVFQGIGRVARSAYFRAFTFPGKDDLQFECDFSTCPNSEDCDGLTCDGGRRNRRQVDSEAASLHIVFSDAVRIRRVGSPRTNDHTIPSAYDYPPDGLASENRKSRMPSTSLPPAPSEGTGPWSLLTTTLVTACVIMAVLLLAAVVYSGCLWKKIHRAAVESVPRHHPYRLQCVLPQLVKRPLYPPPAYHTWEESASLGGY